MRNVFSGNSPVTWTDSFTGALISAPDVRPWTVTTGGSAAGGVSRAGSVLWARPEASPAVTSISSVRAVPVQGAGAQRDDVLAAEEVAYGTIKLAQALGGRCLQKPTSRALGQGLQVGAVDVAAQPDGEEGCPCAAACARESSRLTALRFPKSTPSLRRMTALRWVWAEAATKALTLAAW